MQKTIAQFCLLVLLAVVPVSAMAVGTGDLSASSISNESKQSSSLHQSELEAFSRAAISARDGIAAVENHVVGAKVVDISFDGSDAAPVYRIKALRRGVIWNGRVDASTRNVVLDGSMPIAQLDSDDRSNIAETVRAGFDLSDAVMMAEKHGHGKAVSAGLSRADGKLVFLVVVVSDGRLREVSIKPD